MMCKAAKKEPQLKPSHYFAKWRFVQCELSRDKPIYQAQRIDLRSCTDRK